VNWWLRLPDSWPAPAVATTALVLLTVLDLAGTVAAKEAIERRSAPIAVAGALIWVLMFWVFASTLRVTGLVVVTVGWCVLVQVSVLLMDRFHYGVTMSPGKYVAVVLAVAAQVYLLAGPSEQAPSPAAPQPVSFARGASIEADTVPEQTRRLLPVDDGAGRSSRPPRDSAAVLRNQR
jgi:hypothetical protein